MNPAELDELCARWRNDLPQGYMGIATPPWMIGHVVDWVVDALLERTPTAQAIAFRGISGALVAPIVAYRLGLNVIPIRKGEHSHGGATHHKRALEATLVQRYVIVDDFIESGTTVREIVRDRRVEGCECLGVLLYAKPVPPEGAGPSREIACWRRSEPFEVPAWGCVPIDVWEALYRASREAPVLAVPF